MIYAFGLAAALAAIWIGLSGLFKPLLLGLGVASIIVVVLLAARLKLLDRTAVPYFRLPSFLAYWVWLIWEIAKANVQVIRACLKPELDIAPALVKVKTRCRSDMSKALFANSITLTPGTVSVELEGDKILVHALYEDSAGPDAFEEMDRRSAEAAEGKASGADNRAGTKGAKA